MKALVVANPAAGRGRAEGSEEAIVQAFRDHGVECRYVSTTAPGEAELAARQAASGDLDLVVAVGGDGTVNEVVNGIAGTGVPLGIIPMGTVNVLARELKIPLDLSRAVEVIVNGAPEPIDLGLANNRYFTLMSGLGFDAHVVANVVQPIKDIIGGAAYVFQGLASLARYEATEITLEMPEETYRAKAFLVIVANASTYAYHLKITPHASLCDGRFDICVFEKPLMDKIGFAGQIADLCMRRHLHHGAIRCFRTKAVTVRSNPPIMAQLDGDAFGTTPLKMSVVPGVLPIVKQVKERVAVRV